MKMFDDAYLLELLTLVASSPGRVFALVTVKTNNFQFVNELLFSSCTSMSDDEIQAQVRKNKQLRCSLLMSLHNSSLIN